MRSVSAVPRIDINRAKLYQIEIVPGIGKKTAGKILASKPINYEKLRKIVGEDKAEILREYFIVPS